MNNGRMTILMSSGNYRVPNNRIGSFRFEGRSMFQDLYGDVVDRLGAYEDCKTLQDINNLRKKAGLPEIKK